jgi:hypothetical protein
VPNFALRANLWRHVREESGTLAFYGGQVRQIFFERKFDLGMEVYGALGSEVLRLMPDANAWAWLSLFFHESTIRTKKG